MSSHGAATYSFSSAPKAISARKKYREPGVEADTGVYRDLKETCITWDKRVHRGNTYGMYTQNAIKEALEAANQDQSPAKPRRRVPKEKSIWDMPNPPEERIPVDLTRHLVAKVEIVETAVIEAQTDEFLPEPPPEQYEPQKTGIDAHTQVEDGELFKFDYEVEPILDVLVNKTLEQSIMEVEEEFELATMTDFKGEWYERQSEMMQAWQKQVDEEWVRWEQKEAVMATKRLEKQREARVLLKIQAIAASKAHLAKLVPNAVHDLQEVALPDSRALAIDQFFLPNLFANVQKEVHAIKQAQQKVDEMITNISTSHSRACREGLEVHRQESRNVQKRRLEELQIRQGKIRILVDNGTGTPVQVGPIQLSDQDTIEELQTRVYAWLQQNEPRIAAAWPYGVVMYIDGKIVQATSELFEAKAGQISMAPKQPPPPKTPEEEELVEGEAVDDAEPA